MYLAILVLIYQLFYGVSVRRNSQPTAASVFPS